MLFAPLDGWHHIRVMDGHTAVDYAHVLKDLADIHFPHKKTIVLVPLRMPDERPGESCDDRSGVFSKP
jgi:hypothetical protein